MQIFYQYFNHYMKYSVNSTRQIEIFWPIYNYKTRSKFQWNFKKFTTGNYSCKNRAFLPLTETPGILDSDKIQTQSALKFNKGAKNKFEKEKQNKKKI